MTPSRELLEAVNRFPDENPSPVLRVAADGTLLYANPASRPILDAWGIEAGARLQPDDLERVEAAQRSGRPFDLRSGDRTFEMAVIEVRDLGFDNVYGTEVTAARLVERLPDLNPNPVFRITDDGSVTYANPASAELLAHLEVAVGERLPDEIATALNEIVRSGTRDAVETKSNGHTYLLAPVRIPELGIVNVYATDITARKAIEMFPDENPNPVFRFRWDGKLAYANPASTPIIEALGCVIGQRLSVELLDPLMGQLRDVARGSVEVTAGDRLYSLVAVDVPAFGFINVYGTDITAARELEVAHRENERLLLNILPGPIADRLRNGEAIIADRFDDVTLLFADIVEFTRLSSAMAPDELVTVLNELFTVFDDLVERYRLEKVKTIGDAYMVVGGMPERSDDHPARVASMAIELADRVAGIESAARLGVRFRIGIHCGPVIAGVIGTKKFIYDVWGDTVNVASRMESLGVPGRIQVTGAVEERLRGRFRLEPRGIVEVKGKGPMATWFLEGPAETEFRATDTLIDRRPVISAD